MATPLKDMFFQPAFVTKLAEEIILQYTAFDTKRFTKLIYTSDWEEKPLKERMHTIAQALGETLPKNYKKAISILLTVEKKFDGFDHLVFSDFVEIYGLDDYETSIPALEIFTRSSAEFAIRPFILKYPEKTMQQMRAWSKHKDLNVRRLASEGCRPRLPWAIALPDFQKDPSPVLPILENLKNDPSEYVRRSVANNLNDIAKDHPDTVLEIAKRWKGISKETDKLVKHALRSLLKKGNRQAMQVFGYHDVEGIRISDLAIKPKKVSIGSNAQFSFTLHVEKDKPFDLRLEYEIGYTKARGHRSPKVFQIEESTFTKGKKQYQKKQSFKDLTTRKHHPGMHTLTVIVNGVRLETVEFEVYH